MIRGARSRTTLLLALASCPFYVCIPSVHADHNMQCVRLVDTFGCGYVPSYRRLRVAVHAMQPFSSFTAFAGPSRRCSRAPFPRCLGRVQTQLCIFLSFTQVFPRYQIYLFCVLSPTDPSASWKGLGMALLMQGTRRRRDTYERRTVLRRHGDLQPSMRTHMVPLAEDYTSVAACYISRRRPKRSTKTKVHRIPRD